MKKNIYSLVFFTLILTACSGSSQNKGAENVDSKAEATQIIAYTNNVIDYLNASHNWIGSNSARISEMVVAIENKKTASFGTAIMPNIDFKQKGDVTSPPDVMSEDEKIYFRTNMTAYKASYDALRESCNNLYNYLKNQEFKNDNYAKGIALSDSLQAQLTFIHNKKTELYNKIDVVCAKAEEVMLANDPLKEPILAMKNDLSNFENLFDAFASYADANTTAQQADSAYRVTAANIDNHRTAFADILQKEAKTAQYNLFYQQCDKAMALYAKVLLEIKDKKELAENDFKEFATNHKSLISTYNSFVK